MAVPCARSAITLRSNALLGRSDISIDNSVSPFKELVALPAAVRLMVGVIGPHIVFSGAGGFLQSEAGNPSPTLCMGKAMGKVF